VRFQHQGPFREEFACSPHVCMGSGYEHESDCCLSLYVSPAMNCRHIQSDGAFLVRDCSIITNSEPLVLAVYHEKKVYNVKIRFIEGTNKYALGTTQRSNDMFNSVADIIKFHSIFPIVLISGRSTPGSKYPENCVLTCPVTKRDVDQLLE
uniref:SH2 domain-containing protein n=1 Tax=Sphaeramia orbicularis TaxID=375764 RepID=A0A672ZVA0_9TELE